METAQLQERRKTLQLLLKQEIHFSNNAKTNQILFWHENIPYSCSSICGSTSLTECYNGFNHIVALQWNINLGLLLLHKENSVKNYMFHSLTVWSDAVS